MTHICVGCDWQAVCLSLVTLTQRGEANFQLSGHMDAGWMWWSLWWSADACGSYLFCVMISWLWQWWSLFFSSVFSILAALISLFVCEGYHCASDWKHNCEEPTGFFPSRIISAWTSWTEGVALSVDTPCRWCRRPLTLSSLFQTCAGSAKQISQTMTFCLKAF